MIVEYNENYFDYFVEEFGICFSEDAEDKIPLDQVKQYKHLIFGVVEPSEKRIFMVSDKSVEDICKALDENYSVKLDPAYTSWNKVFLELLTEKIAKENKGKKLPYMRRG